MDVAEDSDVGRGVDDISSAIRARQVERGWISSATNSNWPRLARSRLRPGAVHFAAGAELLIRAARASLLADL